MVQTTRPTRRSGDGRAQSEHVELGIENRDEVVYHLNRILADANVLYIKTKNYHWNVQGPTFYSMHKLLEDQYEALDENIDVVAERIRALGGRPDGSFATFLQNTRLEEADGKTIAGDRIVEELVADHEAVIRHLREDIDTCEEAGDHGTADLLTGFMRKHEKMAWMLRSLKSAGG